MFLGVKFYSDGRQKRHIKDLHQEHSQQILTAEKRRRKREAEEVNGDKAANTQEREGRQAAELREGRQAPEPRHEKDHVVRARYCFRLDHEKHLI